MAIDRTDVPLLRSPPFLGNAATVSLPSATGTIDIDASDTLFALIREARVGGRFWAPPAEPKHPVTIVRIRAIADIDAVLPMLDTRDGAQPTWLVPEGRGGQALARAAARQGIIVAGDTDPWSVLDGTQRLFAHGNDEWIALAHIAGLRVDILSPGRFGAPGDDPALLRSAVLRSLSAAAYRDPFTGEPTTIEAAVAQLADWRRIFVANRTIVAACGIAWWKRREIGHFLRTPEREPRVFRSERRAIAHAARQGGGIAAWPSRISAGMTDAARRKGVPLIRIEDGFVRSAGLGSNLVPPSSIAVDRLGIHYDPTRPSDLEALLATAEFPPPLIARAERLQEIVLRSGISKYGGNGAHAFPARQPGKRLVLVPGQVEDDMSVRLGGGGLASNLELIRRTRALEPDAEIWFRPHPDVDAGHRKGAVRDEDALRHADRVVRGGGMAGLLGHVDAVHVLTSLTGFEALLRGRDVTCHGMPFFAGWGLTSDLGPVPDRRGRRLSLAELVAAVLILYPRYLDPVTHLPCPVEVLVQRMTEGTARNRLGWVTRVRRLQGRLMRRRT